MGTFGILNYISDRVTLVKLMGSVCDMNHALSVFLKGILIQIV